MLRNKFSLAFYSAVVLTCSSTLVVAESKEIRIKDCNDNVQVVESLDQNQSATIKAELPKLTKTDSLMAELKNSAKSMSSAIDKEEVVFSNVAAGEWTLCTTPEKLSFKNIQIVKSEASSISNTAKASVVGLSAAGALAVMLGDSSSDSNDTNKAAEPQVDTQSNAKPVAQTGTLQPETSKPTQLNKPTTDIKTDCNRRDRANPCFIGDDDSVTPIPPLSQAS